MPLSENVQITQRDRDISKALTTDPTSLEQFKLEELRRFCCMIEQGNDALTKVLVILCEATRDVMTMNHVQRYDPKHEKTTVPELLSLVMGGGWAGGLFMVREVIYLARDHMGYSHEMAELLARLKSNKEYFLLNLDIIKGRSQEQSEKIAVLNQFILNKMQRESVADSHAYHIARLKHEIESKKVDGHNDQVKLLIGLTALLILAISGMYFNIFRDDNLQFSGTNNFKIR